MKELQKNCKDEKTYYLCYLDALGFTAQFLENSRLFQNKYKTLISMIENNNDSEISKYLVSDSIVIFSQNFVKIFELTKKLYTWGMKEDFWLRGGLSKGKLNRVPNKYISNISQYKIILPFMGEAYIKAYKLEKKLNFAGINIDEDLLEEEELKNFYFKYKEYYPKPNENNKKPILLPSIDDKFEIYSELYFSLFLDSLSEPKKFINTFCFYIKVLLKRRINFLVNVKSLLEAIFENSKLFPNEIIAVFVTLIEESIDYMKDHPNTDLRIDPVEEIQKVIHKIKECGFLTLFIEHLIKHCGYDVLKKINRFINL